MNIEEDNSMWIMNTLKKWKAKAEQAISVVKLYQRCSKKAETPEDFYHELQCEQIINNKSCR
jgi:hypothetical protein